LFALKRNLYRFLCISFLLDHTVLNLLFTLVGVYSIMSLSCDHMIYPFRESMQGLWDGGLLWRRRTHAHGLFLYIHSILLRFPRVQSRFPLHLLKTSLSTFQETPFSVQDSFETLSNYPCNPVYVRRLDPSVSTFCPSLYRHPSIYILCISRFTSYNKQRRIPKDLTVTNTQERRTTIGIRMMVVRNSRKVSMNTLIQLIIPVSGQINQLSHGIVIPFRSFEGR